MVNFFFNLILCIVFDGFIERIQWWMDYIFPHITGVFIAIALCVIALKLIVFLLRIDIISILRKYCKPSTPEKDKKEKK